MAEINRATQTDRISRADRTTESSADVEEHDTTHTADATDTAARLTAAIAGGVATVVGLVALIRIDWADGIDSAAVDVAGMAFTPTIAIATTIFGLIALAAGAAADRASKLVVGVLLVCVGVGILIAGDDRANWDLETGHGWMGVVVGGVLIAAGLALRDRWSSRRTVRGYQHRA
ncbi:MAG: hypothetical protein MUE36_13005 [Acidimicrobiales bacterium]|jgi:hypothetical protein|nr:hypothetical protein [Acidimicrobiales bacterium]